MSFGVLIKGKNKCIMESEENNLFKIKFIVILVKLNLGKRCKVIYILS